MYFAISYQMYVKKTQIGISQRNILFIKGLRAYLIKESNTKLKIINNFENSYHLYPVKLLPTMVHLPPSSVWFQFAKGTIKIIFFLVIDFRGTPSTMVIMKLMGYRVECESGAII